MNLQCLLQKFQILKDTLTLEPLYFLCCLTENVTRYLYINLAIERSCYYELHHNDTICEGSIFEKGDIFAYVMKELAWQKSPQMILIYTLWIPIFGLICEKSNSKKPFILVPLFGNFFRVLVGLICTIFMEGIPLQVSAILGECLSFSGGQYLMFVIVLIHITDTTSIKDRTLRVGILHIVFYVQNIFLSFWFWHRAIYCNLLLDFSIMFIVALLALIYGFYVMKNESSVLFDCPKISLEAQHMWQRFKQLMTNSTAIFVIMASGALFIDVIMQFGEMKLDFAYFFFTLSVKLEDMESLHKYSTFMSCLGTVVGVILFAKFVPTDDFIIWGISCLHKVLGNLVLCAAESPAIAYFGLAVSSFEALDLVAVDSITTKVVPPEYLIKVRVLFTIFAMPRLWDAATDGIYLNWIYKKTFRFFPSAYLWFGVILSLGCLPFVVWLYFTNKRDFGRAILVEEMTDINISDRIVLNPVITEPE